MTITQLTVVQGIALQPGPKGDPGAQGPPGAATNIDVARGWTTLQYIAPTDLAYVAGGTTLWDTAAHQNAKLQLTGGNTTMGAPTNVVEGAYYALRTIQDSTQRTITWDTHYHWPGGAANAQQPSAPNGAIDVFHWRGAVGGILEFVGALLNIKA